MEKYDPCVHRDTRRLEALTTPALNPAPADRAKYLAAGFDEYVTKPIVDERVLLEAIEKLLER